MPQILQRPIFIVALVLAGMAVAFIVLGGTAEGDPKSKPAALSGHTVVFNDSAASTDQLQSALVQCPEGKGVISGGYDLSNSTVQDIVVLANHPSQELSAGPVGERPTITHDGWLVEVRRLDESPIPWSVLAYAVCVDTL